MIESSNCQFLPNIEKVNSLSVTSNDLPSQTVSFNVKSSQIKKQLSFQQQIILLKIQSSFLNIFALLNSKVLTCKNQSLRRIKSCPIDEQIITKKEAQLFMLTTHTFNSKVGNVLQKNMRRNVWTSFGQIYIFSKKKGANSFETNSSMSQSGQQNSKDQRENVLKERNFLKNKKEKMKEKKNQFFHQMNNLLSSHEAYLKIK